MYFMEYLFTFVFYYPVAMAFVWIFGAFIFRYARASDSDWVPVIENEPMVSILVPCRNEEDCIEETVNYLERQHYSNFEIIAINDGSTDNTEVILKRLMKEHPRLRVLNMKSNQGKGTGLTMAAMVSRGEYLVGIDADSLLDPNALRWFVWHFETSPRVGAVTGNPKVRNRTSVLGKIQVGEYSTIIGMIKRAQRVLGKIYTVSGVVAAFRKKALLDVGFWSNNMVTEDIDVSWKLELHFWDIRYEARALCWIFVPETLAGVFRQRLRWAQGGNEVLMKYFKCLFDFRERRIWPLFMDYFVSVIWCYSLALTAILYLLGLLIKLPPELQVRSLLPGWTGVILGSICLLQMGVGLIFDARYDRTMVYLLPYLIWYPALYWLVNCVVTIIAFPKALFKRKTTLAVWESPDRGMKLGGFRK